MSTDVRSIAAELGRRGGLVSKRPPGVLRQLLIGVCEEKRRSDNRAIFDYWQTCRAEDEADNAPESTHWFRHRMWAEYSGSSTWTEPTDSDYRYFYFDGQEEQETSAKTIRQTMARIRKADKRLSATSP